MNPDLAFVVIDKDGHQFKIYAHGVIEGFGDGCKVVNYIPSLARQHVNMSRMSHDLEPLPPVPTQVIPD